MRLLLVAAMVAATLPTSVEAQRPGGSGFTAGLAANGSGVVQTHRGESFTRDGRHRRDGRRERRGSNGDTFFAYRDYQGDSLWRSDSFNDWWHDRPDRSYPAWVARNAKCERLWWSGGDWRC